MLRLYSLAADIDLNALIALGLAWMNASDECTDVSEETALQCNANK